MKRFVLKFELKNRTDPGQIVIVVVAEKEGDARRLASRQEVECPREVWLDPSKTSCESRRTRQKVPGVLSVGKR